MEKELFDTPKDKVQPEDMEVKKVPEGILSTDGKVEFTPLPPGPPMIYKKILDIQEEVPAVLKTHEVTDKYGKKMYDFRGIDDLYNAMSPLFKKHRVFMTPKVINRESTEKKSSSGSTIFYEKMDVIYKLFAEDGSFEEATTTGIGMDSGDKAANKAMSTAQKYALIQVFNIPTKEAKDPEIDQHEIANEDLLEIMKNLEGCKDMEGLSILWDSLEKDQKSNKMIRTVFSNHKAKLKGGKK